MTALYQCLTFVLYYALLLMSLPCQLFPFLLYLTKKGKKSRKKRKLFCTMPFYSCLLFALFICLEERIISRFGSTFVELFWYYHCTLAGMLYIVHNNNIL
ncbi:hypothetical protein CsSME_00011525 [Camellia sinensis var. sinensis]